MEHWVAAVAVLDVVIVAVLIFMVVRMRQLPSGGTPSELGKELEELKALTDGFRKKQKELDQYLEKVKANHKRLEEVIARLEESIEEIQTQATPPQDNREELYQRAKALLKEGLSQQEVAKRLNLSRAEVALLTKVERMRKN